MVLTVQSRPGTVEAMKGAGQGSGLGRDRKNLDATLGTTTICRGHSLCRRPA
jgi:hypothetical protein